VAVAQVLWVLMPCREHPAATAAQEHQAALRAARLPTPEAAVAVTEIRRLAVGFRAAQAVQVAAVQVQAFRRLEWLERQIPEAAAAADVLWKMAHR
jgi:hypothetical protein